MPFFSVSTSEITIHFWIYTRLFEAILLLTAVYFLTRRLNVRLMVVASTIIAAVIMWASLSAKAPTLLTEEGLTPLKIAIEYVVIAILLVAIFLYISYREYLAKRVLYYLVSSLLLTIFAELFFTLYTDFYGVPFVIGHLFKFLSFWMIYQAIVQTTLKEPFSVMAQQRAPCGQPFGCWRCCCNTNPLVEPLTVGFALL